MDIQHNIQLQPYNSFRTKASARLFCEPSSTEELLEILKSYPREKKLIVGAGFNIFFTHDFDGLVIKPGMRGITIVSEDAEHVEIEAGAAEEWDQFVGRCVANGYAGLENLSLIPSSVGASPIQNIGAYGSEAKDTIVKVKAVDIRSGDFREFTHEECAFGYRDSVFKQTRRYVITSVVFRLSKSFTYKEKYIDLSRELEGIDSPSLAQVRNAIIRIRTRKLPDYNLLPNAGSFFKNPVLTTEEKDILQKKLADVPIYNVGEGRFKTSAAFLIEKAGLRGKRSGMVGTYEHHALIIVNYGTENGQDIVDFMHGIQYEVKKQFGIMLEPEVWIF
ncbi:UDP-N-acetylmuramate dehydrogenase [Proteiniphilum sp. UBA1028]|uniref:UDP-N-acetylmuramate dehydrogenase n=1 Tax=Proteiniphilum sp. UBA1028 TaxID=1947251 RepID=UPI000E845FA5|nr:UDP-N-acetylmuramate dehydrogenase [Proteiniphilum sp. UBA1028]HBG57583.1 UDP-N-acetylmuramate dehydrogenase [Porphyromonadaceae bacterium]